jgi:prolyl-tRNA synthetase
LSFGSKYSAQTPLLQVDGNDMKTPGWRYNYWELKGVPLRVEVGPRDVEQGTCVLARRDMPGELAVC